MGGKRPVRRGEGLVSDHGPGEPARGHGALPGRAPALRAQRRTQSARGVRPRKALDRHAGVHRRTRQSHRRGCRPAQARSRPYPHSGDADPRLVRTPAGASWSITIHRPARPRNAPWTPISSSRHRLATPATSSDTTTSDGPFANSRWSVSNGPNCCRRLTRRAAGSTRTNS